QKLGVVSAELDSASSRVIATGESENLTYRVPNTGIIPVKVYLEAGSDGVKVTPPELEVGARDSMNATVTLTAPPETGYYRRFVTEHRYLALLPEPVIDALYSTHPWLPVLIIDSLLGLTFYGTGILLVGSGRIRKRKREKKHGSAVKYIKKFIN
ncbi:MAG: S26 family signal peptidase, partial [Halobacteria archaeon]|nr:S26 family signal peptidase [Halobacteria archaeon]